MTQYLDHTQLQCSPEEREGLIALIAEFRSPQAPVLVDNVSFWGMPNFSADVLDKRDATTTRMRLGFQMSFGTGLPAEGQRNRYNCGSAACIGGHLSLKMQGFDTTGNSFPIKALDRANDYVGDYNSFSERPFDLLFYPRGVDSAWHLITPAMAADAIENTLRTGSPDWVGIFEQAGLTEFIDSDD